MLQQVLSLSFISLFSLMLLSLLSVSTGDSNIYVKCSQLYFMPTTPYESNLNSLFTSLIDSASVSNFNKFETSTTPGDSLAGDNAYGLFQCRGDINSSNCKDCVTSSVSQLKTACPMSTSGTIQLEECFVKYDNTSFFGAENKMEVLKRCGPPIDHNSDLQKRIDDALAYLTSGNGQYFREGNFGSMEGVAQCVQDLSVSDCQDCLSEAVVQLRSECGTSSWGNMFLGTCYIQYADNGIGNNSSESAKLNGGRGNNNGISRWIGYVLSGLISSAFSITASYKITIRKTNNYYNNVIKTTLKEVKIQVEETSKEIKDTKKKLEDAKKKKDEKWNYELPYGIPRPCPYPYPYC